MVATLLRTPASWLAELDRLERAFDRGFGAAGLPVSIRAASGAAFPAVNIGSSAQAVDVYAFVPGVDAGKLEVTVDHNLLSIAGERELPAPAKDQVRYAEERFAGRFRRVVSLPDDVDASKVQARYIDGVLHVNIARREASQPRRISVS